MKGIAVLLGGLVAAGLTGYVLSLLLPSGVATFFLFVAGLAIGFATMDYAIKSWGLFR